MRFGVLSLIVLSSAVGHAQTNFAAAANGGVATQSSTGFSGPAGRANDGNRSGNWSSNSVSHTNSEFGAWWEVAFASVQEINQILIFNRTDCCSNRIDTFSVRLYDSGGSEVWSDTNNTFTPTITGTNLSGMQIDAPGVLAKRLRVQLDGTNYLHVAEVEAYNVVPEPATLAALAAGIGLVSRRLRRRTA